MTNEDDQSANTYDDLARLIQTINGSTFPGGDGRFDSTAFRESVEGILNARAFLRWAGVNLLIGSWDNYFATPSNYFLYNSGPRGPDQHPQGRPDPPARPLRGEPMQRRRGGTAAGGLTACWRPIQP